MVKNTLKELKDKINSVVNLEKLFVTTTKLLDAVEGLAPDQKSTLEEVKTVVNTVQDVANAQQEIEAILTQIDQIVQKLAAV